jgi:hypothetical protein
MPSDTTQLKVRVRGRLGGRELAGNAALTIGDEGLELRSESTRLSFSWESMEGCVASAQDVELLLLGGDRLLLRPAQEETAALLVRDLLSHACAIPELTRPLRTFWAPRARPDSAHERFFSPLLSASMRAARMLDSGDRARSLDAGLLRRDMRAALRAIATDRVPVIGAEQRALEAELEEVTRPVFASLHALAQSGEELARAPTARQISAWREWTRALSGLFATADAVWPRVRNALENVGPPPARWVRWRRWLRLGA